MTDLASMARPRHVALLTICTALLVATGCKIEGGFTDRDVGNIAVAAGDFDDIADPLDRVPVSYDTYEGIISVPTWDPSWDHTQVALSVEELLGEGQEVFRHDTVFIASGVRGLGMREYNGLDPDDGIVSDAAAVENVRNYVQNGQRYLIVTDWAYDIVEAAWPDAIDFLNEDSLFDDAQRGEIDDITADVVDETLAEALGSETMGINYNYSNWAVIEGVGADTTVLISGDARYRFETEAGDGVNDIADVPMLVSFQPRGALGTVVYATFHIDAQNDAAIDAVLKALIGDFQASEANFEEF